MTKVCGLCNKTCEYSAWIYGTITICTDCKEGMEPSESVIIEKNNKSVMKELLFTVAMCILVIFAVTVYILVKPS